MDKQKQIEEMAKEIVRVLFEIRQDMTSVIRYIRHDVNKEKELYSNFTLGRFVDRHLKYRQLADETSRNILKNLNENHKLKEIENLCVDIARNGLPENAVVLTREECQMLNYFNHRGEELLKQERKETAEKFAELTKKAIINMKWAREDTHIKLVTQEACLIAIDEICKELGSE